MDWWTKYFSSLDKMIKDGKINQTEATLGQGESMKDIHKKRFSKNPLKTVSHAAKVFGTKMSPKVQRRSRKFKSRIALMKVKDNLLQYRLQANFLFSKFKFNLRNCFLLLSFSPVYI